jgi:GntR family transcriptional regulator, transcriptional repressor for pyruvate dehydrogenase complex
MTGIEADTLPDNNDIGVRMKTEHIQRKTLAEQVTESIFDHILNHMQPDDALPSIEQLALDFNVSRIVIREALKTLEAHGIIDINSGKKASVRPVSGDIFKIYFQRVFSARKNNYLELVEFRRAIETVCVVLAAQRRTDEELERMAAIYRQMEQAISDPVLYTRYDLDFHIEIAIASHNSVLKHLVTSLRDVIKDAIESSLRDRQDEKTLRTSLNYHKRIVKAIREKDTKSAERAITMHFDDTVHYFSQHNVQKD